jgi:hypothetical protein
LSTASLIFGWMIAGGTIIITAVAAIIDKNGIVSLLVYCFHSHASKSTFPYPWCRAAISLHLIANILDCSIIVTQGFGFCMVLVPLVGINFENGKEKTIRRNQSSESYETHPY